MASWLNGFFFLKKKSIFILGSNVKSSKPGSLRHTSNPGRKEGHEGGSVDTSLIAYYVITLLVKLTISVVVIKLNNNIKIIKFMYSLLTFTFVPSLVNIFHIIFLILDLCDFSIREI